MSTEAQTLATLIEFFTNNQSKIALILQKPNDVEIWEEIFFAFFNEYPVNDESKDVPCYWRKGSSDPRWDELLPKKNMAAMQAMDTFIVGIKNNSIFISSNKEAA